jgi:hypothetical protein
MTDHIGEATKKVIDLDVLDKRLRGAADDFANHATPIEGDGQTATLLREAADVTAELKEAKEHLARCVELVPAPGAIEAADAFLARNGKGEG